MVFREDFSPSLRRLTDRQAEMTDLLCQWVEINSFSHNLPGIARMADAFIEAFQALPGKIERVPLESVTEFTSRGHAQIEPSGEAIRIRCRPEAPFQVLLSGHVDTVYPPESPFQKAIVDGDILRGPGSADMKGGLVVMLHALRHFEELGGSENLGWQVIIVPDEEIGSRASNALYVEAAKGVNVGLIVEPSLPNGGLARARKGTGSFNAHVTGLSSHVGRAFHEGRNAIAALAELITRVHGLNGKIDGAIFNVGRVDGGGPLNVVPDEAAAQFNLRVTEPASIPIVHEQLAAIVRATEEDTGCQIRWEGDFTRPPKPHTPALEALFQQTSALATELGQNLHWKDTGGCSDGNNLAALGVTNLDSLGVVGGNIHNDQEFAILSSLPQRAALLASLLHEWASGRIPPEISQPNLSV